MRVVGLLVCAALAVAGSGGRRELRIEPFVERSGSRLEIVTPSGLPWATAYQPYSVALQAEGGVPPYVWGLAEGSLPPGISLSVDGTLSGTTEKPGTYYFWGRVTDSVGSTATKVFGLVVALPSVPVVSVTGLLDNVSAAQQLPFDVELSATYPKDIEGSVTLGFEPNAVNFADDPNVRFASGGRIIYFRIPAGQRKAQWTTPPILQTGTVAGKIKLQLAYWSEGINLTPTIPPVRSVTLPRSVPSIQAAEVVRKSGGFDIVITGYSTPREVKSATFNFSITQAGETRTASFELSVEEVFTNWYKSAESVQFGSAFVYTQPFTVQGNMSDIKSVTIKLTSTAGSSTETTVEF